MKELKVAIVHDYLNQAGGAERVVASFRKLFPNAPIYTTIVDRDKLYPELRDAVIHTTFMQRIPGILKRFKLFFWLYPLAVRTMDVREYDLVLSSSSAYAKGVRKGRRGVHVCYCHTPMRFAWDFEGYMEGTGVPAPVKTAARWIAGPLRLWDRMNSRRVDGLFANSSVVQGRIRRHYGLAAPVIYPPVDVSRFSVSPEPPGDELLVVSRLVSYKRIDLAVEACTRLGLRLTVIGDGPDRARLERLAGPTVTFLGRQSDEEVVQHMQRCRAFLFPGEEDFGITPLEANACGRPVIAYKGGGALDTVIPGLNGLYFEEQTAASLERTLTELDGQVWDPARIRHHAETFREDVFLARLEAGIRSVVGRGESEAAALQGSAALWHK